MNELVVLLRGINVGRNKRIGMADLRALLGGLGYERVRTHLQSGNAIVATVDDPETVARAVERAIDERFGFDVDVIVRTAGELADVVAANPLAASADDPSRHLVLFLPAELDDDALRAIAAHDFSPELLAVRGRELYLWCPAGTQDSKLMKALGRAHIAKAGTARNWNTVARLLELVDSV